MTHSSFQAYADCYNNGGRRELLEFYASDARFMAHTYQMVVGREGKLFINYTFS